MREYIALIHKSEGSDYGVSFPDLPGCVSAASSLSEAHEFAEDVLALHLQGLVQDGEAVPEPSTLEVVMADRENRDAVAILVPAKVNVRSVRVNITMPADVLERIDAYAGTHGMTRSGLLVQAAKREMKAA